MIQEQNLSDLREALKNSDDLKQAFKNASPLIREFIDLRNRPDSKFKFELDNAFGNTALIHPEIETPHSSEMTILVNANGDVQGDDGRFYTSEKVIAFVKKEAKKQGLVP